mgnify:FL=1
MLDEKSLQTWKKSIQKIVDSGAVKKPCTECGGKLSDRAPPIVIVDEMEGPVVIRCDVCDRKLIDGKPYPESTRVVSLAPRKLAPGTLQARVERIVEAE